MKKRTETFIIIFLVFIISFVSISMYSRYLDREIERLFDGKRVSALTAVGLPAKDKGNILISMTSDPGTLFVMGSSELTSGVPQNIRWNFPNDIYSGDVSSAGHAFVQNYLHAMDLGANYEYIKDCNLVIIESLQWYLGADIDRDGFLSNFSELQFYDFIHNDRISRENKIYLCKRYISLENRTKRGAYQYPQTYILARTFSSNNLMVKGLYQIVRPYYAARYKFLELKDKYNVYKYLKDVSAVEKTFFKTNWDLELEKAEEEGKAACTNNDIYVNDEFYTNHIADRWDKIEGIHSDSKLAVSQEWEDFKFFMGLCNDLGLKPLIINVSTNGYYYDYTGLDRELREEHYRKLSELADEYGFDIYNELTEKEYEPYVFGDTMHLGWKGWIYVTKAVTDYFS